MDAVNKRLQGRIDRAVMKAVNMRVHSETRIDAYALEQADTLSEARAFGEAINIVISEYKRLTEPEKVPDEAEQKEKPKPLAESVY